MNSSVPPGHTKNTGNAPLRNKNERVGLEMQILKYRQMARQMAAASEEAERIRALVADLEQKL
jgi:hypothetical protein